jgi:hypothetical protein
MYYVLMTHNKISGRPAVQGSFEIAPLIINGHDDTGQAEIAFIGMFRSTHIGISHFVNKRRKIG